MLAAIEKIIFHHKILFRGTNPLEPTGPYLLGKIVEKFSGDATVVIGQTVLINQDKLMRNNIVKLMPDGQLITVRNKGSNSSISEFLPDGGNDYTKMWHEGSVWESAMELPPDENSNAKDLVQLRFSPRRIGRNLRSFIATCVRR